MWNSFHHAHLDYYVPPMRASVVATGQPAAEVISLQAMKEYLRDPASSTVNDDRISSLIISARVHCERHTGRSVSKKPYLMSLTRFPNAWLDRTNVINLWYPPLTSMQQIKYIDLDGMDKTLLSGKDFQVDFAGTPGRVAPLAQTIWPQTKYGVLNAVQIPYIAGYEPNSDQRLAVDALATNIEEPETEEVSEIPSDSQVTSLDVDRTIPSDLVIGIMQLVLHWYQNRAPVISMPGAGGKFEILPWHIEKIFDDYKFDTMTPTLSPDF